MALATRELLDHVLLDLLIAGHLEDTDEPLSIEPGNVRRGAARSTFGPTDDGFPWQSDRKARPKHPRDRLHEDALAIRSKPIMEHEILDVQAEQPQRRKLLHRAPLRLVGQHAVEEGTPPFGLGSRVISLRDNGGNPILATVSGYGLVHPAKPLRVRVGTFKILLAGELEGMRPRGDAMAILVEGIGRAAQTRRSAIQRRIHPALVLRCDGPGPALGLALADGVFRRVAGIQKHLFVLVQLGALLGTQRSGRLNRPRLPRGSGQIVWPP